jgi:hypothetical protein
MAKGMVSDWGEGQSQVVVMRARTCGESAIPVPEVESRFDEALRRSEVFEDQRSRATAGSTPGHSNFGPTDPRD